MHLSDALVSTPVAIAGGVVAAGLLAVAGSRLKSEENPSVVPLMGLSGAFVLAAQMIHFAIPGTGSAAHIIGGVLLGALLGPWPAFITMASVMIVQCLVFAHGGFLALGCNLLNMGAASTLIAYPFIFRPICGQSKKIWRIAVASVVSCVVALELAALMVSFETVVSGITALSIKQFLTILSVVNLPVGICEGLATAAVLGFVRHNRPELLEQTVTHGAKKSFIRTMLEVAVCIVLILFAWWIGENTEHMHEVENMAAHAVPGGSTSLSDNYTNPLSGTLGTLFVLIIVWSISSLFEKKWRR